MSRLVNTFGALVAVQAAHSIEECWGKLWESFPPARFVAGLISADHERGFIMGNVVLVALGAWCFFWPVRRQWKLAVPMLWFWTAIEIINGLGHPLWSLREGGYTPGVATAPVLLCLAIYLAIQLRWRSDLPTRGMLRPGLSAQIRAHIDRLASSKTGTPIELAARQFNALPLHNGWDGWVLLMESGDVIEEMDGIIAVVSEPNRTMYLVVGSECFPELQELLPERPVNSETCGLCGGTSWVPFGDGKVRCGECRCLGWKEVPSNNT